MASIQEFFEDRVVLEVYEACARRAAAEPRRDYLGMSRIGQRCERALWLDVSGAERMPVEGRIARVFNNGHVREDCIVADLEAAGYKIDGKQDEFSDFDGRFRGHRDGVIHGVTQRPHLLEIKTANADQFKAFKRQGVKHRPEYEAQMQCYMGYSELERGYFVVENKNNQELYTERVYFNPQAFKELQAKAGRILAATEPPEKIGDDTECRFCDFRHSCDHPPEVPSAAACSGCVHYRPKENSAAASVDIVQVLRVFVETLRLSSDLNLGRNILEAERLLKLALNLRPDLSLPRGVWVGPRGAKPASRFTGILEYVLSYKNSFCLNAYLDTTDPLTTRFFGATAGRDWCAHTGHRLPIYTPMGCDDYDNGQVPF